MAKIASKQAASTQRSRPTVDFSLNYNRPVEPPICPEEADEIALWLNDLSELGLVQHLDPKRQRLTGHIAVRTPDKVRKNG